MIKILKNCAEKFVLFLRKILKNLNPRIFFFEIRELF